MKKLHMRIAVLMFLFVLKAGELATAQNTYTINTENIVHTIDEKVYGHFLEHIFFSLY